MRETVHLNGKPVVITLSNKAKIALGKRDKPLIAEMELYFSCFIRKKTRFHDESGNTDYIKVIDGLEVSFRPVMTKACSVSDLGDNAPDVIDFPICNPSAFVPHWLKIDYKKGKWYGEFGYH